MFREILICSLFIASLVFVNGVPDSLFIDRIEDAKNTCMSKFNTTTLLISKDKPLPSPKQSCIFSCMLLELGILDENCLNEDVDKWLHKYFELASDDGNFFQRLYVKHNEIRNICSVNDDVARDQKWEAWLKQQLPFFILETNGTVVNRNNVTEMITAIKNSGYGWNETKTMLIKYFANITVEKEVTSSVCSPFVNSVKEARTVCMATFDVTGDTLLEFLNNNSSESISGRDHLYALYCTLLRLGLVNENGINKMVENWFRNTFEDDYVLELYQFGVNMLRSLYEKHITENKTDIASNTIVKDDFVSDDIVKDDIVKNAIVKDAIVKDAQ